jgi:DNA primase
MLEKVGLIAQRNEGNGYYDRFRDRVIFPIRDAHGQPLGFGGRVLPGSPMAAKAPKYYNSAETELFKKSDMLYGLDQAQQAAKKLGYLAVVEGYTDTLMAHQLGIPQVVATMGTALNARHVQHLRRFVPQVVLVFDADDGGSTGVDRALQIFAGNDMDLRVATLPEGKDPCDLLVEQGPEPFRTALEQAVDALDFKLAQVLGGDKQLGIEGRRRAVDAVLAIIALAPDMPGQTGAVKRQLMVTRIAQRLSLKEETLWARLEEIRQTRRHDPRSEGQPGGTSEQRQAPAPEVEKQLLQVLLADPDLVLEARKEVAPEQITHPGLRSLLEGMYRLIDAGVVPDLDQLRPHIDNPLLAELALRWQDFGRQNSDRPAWLKRIMEEFRRRQVKPVVQELHNQLQAVTDHLQAVELLRRLQNPNGAFE